MTPADYPLGRLVETRREAERLDQTIVVNMTNDVPRYRLCLGNCVSHGDAMAYRGDRRNVVVAVPDHHHVLNARVHLRGYAIDGLIL